MPIDGWRLHRRMEMSGGLFKRGVMRELGRAVPVARLKQVDRRHAERFRRFMPQPQPLPGAVELLRFLRHKRVPHGVATSNRRPHFDSSLKALGVPKDMVAREESSFPFRFPLLRSLQLLCLLRQILKLARQFRFPLSFQHGATALFKEGVLLLGLPVGLFARDLPDGLKIIVA